MGKMRAGWLPLSLVIAAGAFTMHQLEISPASKSGGEISGPTFPLNEDGFVPAWLVVGPFDQPLVGFGEAVDSDVIGESSTTPVAGQVEETSLVDGGSVAWKPLHITEDGFLDFNASMGWVLPSSGPEKIWKAKVGYAFTYIDSPARQDVILQVGSNSSLKVMLNGLEVHASANDRDAEPDTDAIQMRLREGRNRLLVKVGQTHRNEAPQFFGEIRYEWGFYARIVDLEGNPAKESDGIRRAGKGGLGGRVSIHFLFQGNR